MWIILEEDAALLHSSRIGEERNFAKEYRRREEERKGVAHDLHAIGQNVVLEGGNDHRNQRCQKSPDGEPPAQQQEQRDAGYDPKPRVDDSCSRFL